MIVTGSDGYVSVNATQVLKCIRWTGTLSRRFVERTSRGFTDIDYIPGKRVFTGEITALTIVESDGITDLETQFLEDAPIIATIQLWLDKANTKGFTFNGYVRDTSARLNLGAAGEKTYTVASTGPITSSF